MSEKETNPTPPWASEIPEGSFISYTPTYKVGEYFNRFHKASFEKMSYYYYDPTEYGYEKGKAYPVFIFLHGTSNALEGDVCINYAGAEFYSKEEYQKPVCGAYILVPLANEYRDENGNVKGAWDESYAASLYDLINMFIINHAKKNGGINKKFIFGNSSGGRMAIKMATIYPDFFDAVIPMGASEIPDEKLLDLYDQHNISLFFAMGKRDEFNDYQKEIVPLLPRMKRMKNCYVFTPEWVYNGDKGIASINFGVEMGQHCIINPMHCNLMFDDGTPMEPDLPKGVIGWLTETLKKLGG